MPNYATITVCGHMTRDAEFKVAANGTEYAKFTVAVNTGFGDKKTVTFWDVTLFGKSANTAQQLHKGDPVLVEGEPSIRDYERADGTKGRAAEIMARRFVFLKGRDAGAGEGGGHSAGEAQHGRANAKPAAHSFGDMDEVPF